MRNKFVLRPIIACLPGIFLALSAPIHAGETIVYNDTAATTGAMLQNGPSFFGNPNMLFPGTSASPGASDNSVTVNYNPSTPGVHNPFYVLGGLADNTEVRDNTVNLVNGSVGVVYGGFSNSGAAINNSVTLSGGSVDYDVHGGLSYSSAAINNSVTINDGIVRWGAYGGVSDSGTAINNSVILNGGSVDENVYGGFSYSATATGNSVTMSNGVVIGSVYGGYSQSGTATGNSVMVSGGTVSQFVYGGYTNDDATTNNSVTVRGGTVNWNVIGGNSYSGAATDNRVTVSGGTVSGGVYGGTSISGDVSDNSVTVSGGTVNGDVHGGSSGSGAATDNSITLSGGSVGGNVSGGYSGSNATNNSVTISGGSVGGDVIGGDSWTSTATGNSVTYSGGAITGSIYGGFTSGSGDVFSGNALDVKGAGLSVGGDLKNFQFLNFYLPSTMTAGATALTVGGVADLTDGAGASSTVNVGIEGGSSPLKAGDTITLIDAGTLTTESGLNTTANGQAMQGISLLYDFNLSTQDNQLIATIVSDGNGGDDDHPAHVNPQTKALSEGRIAGLAFASQGGDLIAGPGMAALVADTDQQAGSLTAFGVMSGGSSRYNTGSHVDVDGVSLMTGLGWRAPLAQNALHVGAFVEAGWGNYDSHNAFSNAASVNGSGDTHYYGLGMLARYELTDSALKGLYADASLRAGRTATDFSSDDLRDAQGRIARYDSHSSYYGAHAGIGYVWHLNDQSSLDFSSKYLWTRQGSDAVTVVGDPVRFDAADSSRWRNGVRFSHTLATAAGKPLSVYAGAYYEHEFDGKVNATTYGYAIDTPELKGDTGIGELGLRYRPQAANGNTGGFSLDAGIQGYVGDRRGMSGNVRMMYAF